MRLSNRMRLLRGGLLLLGPILALTVLVPCFGQQMHRNLFESNRTSWIKGTGDVAHNETAHAMTDQVAHEGQRSEHVQINAQQGQGSHIYYFYPTAKAPISDELTVSVWIKSNRPGIQLMGRVVLPKEVDPTSPEDRLVTIVRGATYRKVGSWERLEIARPVKLAKEQQQLMQNQLNRAVSFQDAFLDKLVLNVYGGAGETDVWIDELEIGPVFEAPTAKAVTQPLAQEGPVLNKPSATGGKFVQFNGSSLQVDGKRFFFRGVRFTDTPPQALRDAGFNTLFVDYPWDPAMIKKMVDLGFWLVPSLPAVSDDPRLVSADNLTREVRNFPEQDAILGWMLGNALAHEQTVQVARNANVIASADKQHPLMCDAWDGLARYSNSINLVSVHRWPLMTTLELSKYKEWLESRSRLANPGTFMWTWIQTHTPEWYTQMLYDKPASAGFTEPIGPQPEHIRLLTYLAVGSGFRGLGFWSDRFLANSHQGRDRLLTVALLNQELEFLEPMLNSADIVPQWIDTSDPNVKAAVLRTQRGLLVLPMWLGSSSQFVPGQAAVSKLTMTVPQVPPSFQCWEVTPGEVRSIKIDHGATGGMKLTLREFGLTTAIAFTSDITLIQHFQELCAARRQLAAQYTYDLAVQELEKVAKVEEQLQKGGHVLPDGNALMQDANDRLKVAKNYWDNHQYGDAYREAQRALRPVRIMMRAQWETAIRGLETPVASPWAVSYYTLPKHWEFMDQIKASTQGPNALVGGGFEVVPGRIQESWQPQESTLDDVELKAERVSEVSIATVDPKSGKPGARATLTAKEGKQFLLLEVKPKVGERPAPKALERTYLAINSPTVKLAPGSVVCVSGWMAVPDEIQASTDGALLFDNAGGEPLAVRMTAPTGGWKQFKLYRRVPASGTVNVTLALTGLGRVAFDDVRIEPMVGR